MSGGSPREGGKRPDDWTNTGRWQRGKVVGHDAGRASEKAVRGCDHPADADRNQLRKASLVRSRDLADGAGPARRRPPLPTDARGTVSRSFRPIARRSVRETGRTRSERTRGRLSSWPTLQSSERFVSSRRHRSPVAAIDCAPATNRGRVGEFLRCSAIGWIRDYRCRTSSSRPCRSETTQRSINWPPSTR